MKKLSLPLALTAALAVTAGGCSSNTQGDSASPVFLTCDFTLLPAVWNVASNALLQFQTTTLTSKLKSPSSAGGSTTFLDTQVDTYAVVWTRIDGGRTASKTESFGGNVIVPAGGTGTLTNYPFMSISALQQPPLSFLWPSNGGIDPETGRTEIRQTGTVTFYGHTMSGQPVTSVPAVFNMTFIYSAAAGRVEVKRSR
jgi:hypothetical protein